MNVERGPLAGSELAAREGQTDGEVRQLHRRSRTRVPQLVGTRSG
jgi:hypothetical protein